MLLSLLTLSALLPLISAQCTTLGGTCQVCSTPLQTVNSATLANCHISSPTSSLIYVGNNDIRGIINQWRTHAKNAASSQQRFCPEYSMPSEYNLGCFLKVIYPRYGGSFYFPIFLSSLQPSTQTAVRAILGSSTFSDGDFITAVRTLLQSTRGRYPFPSLASEFTTYTQLIARAEYWAGSQGKSDAEEHAVYIYWTLLPNNRLTNSQFQKYTAYQKLGGGALPRKRQASSNNVFSIETLRSTCPTANNYLTAGCLLAVASNCEADDAGCRSYFINGIAVSYQAPAKQALTLICPLVKSTFPRVCAKVSTF